MKLVVLALLVTTATAFAQSSSDPAEPAPSSDRPPAAAAPSRPFVPFPGRFELGVHAGVAVGSFAGNTFNVSGQGPAADVEIGYGNHLVSVMAYVDVAELSPGLDRGPYAIDVGIGERVRLNLWRAFVGVGLGVGFAHGSQSGGSDDGTMLEIDLHVGYTFPKIGRVAPQLLVVFQTGATLFPADQDFPALVGNPAVTSTRFALGGAF